MKSIFTGGLLLLTLWCSPASAQQNGFVKIFDGKTLNGWRGDLTHWKVENGSIVGEVTPSNQLKENTFLIWEGGTTENFELKIAYKISEGGNSGIQYRSEELTGAPFRLKGYQADIDGKNEYTGLNYEERGRGFIARRGESMVMDSLGKPDFAKSLGASDELAKSIKAKDWNEYHLIVRGNHMQHYINGVLMSEAVDNDLKNRKFSGLLGLQAHVTPEMRVEFKNIEFKKLH
ncbi:3-keto-disaccharide hydrolase [Pedobacter sp. PWIIR3]